MTRRFPTVLTLFLCATGLLVSAARMPEQDRPAPADLVLTNGRVVTVEDGDARGAGGARSQATGSPRWDRPLISALRRAEHEGHRREAASS